MKKTSNESFLKLKKEKIEDIIMKLFKRQSIDEILNKNFVNIQSDNNEYNIDHLISDDFEDRTMTSISFSNSDAPILSRKIKRKSFKQITDCPHEDRKHYAKNMCYTCYHRQGREKKAWVCEHSTHAHYALGLCHNCYQNKYLFKKLQFTNYKQD